MTRERTFGSTEELSEERKNQIARRVLTARFMKSFKLEDNGAYRRGIGAALAEINGARADGDPAITADEFHQMVLAELPRALGRMFGWIECGITGKTGH